MRILIGEKCNEIRETILSNVNQIRPLQDVHWVSLAALPGAISPWS